MDSSHLQALQCGVLTSRFGFEVSKYQDPDPLGHAGNAAFGTTVLMEAMWYGSEGFLPTAVHVACCNAREMIEHARTEHSVGSAELGHRHWMLIASGGLLSTPCHELFWIGFAVGAYATWPRAYKEIAKRIALVRFQVELEARHREGHFDAPDGAKLLARFANESENQCNSELTKKLAQLRDTALSAVHVNTVRDYRDMKIARVDGLEKLLRMPPDDGKDGLKESARTVYKQLSCCVPEVEPIPFGFRSEKDPQLLHTDTIQRDG